MIGPRRESKPGNYSVRVGNRAQKIPLLLRKPRGVSLSLSCARARYNYSRGTNEKHSSIHERASPEILIGNRRTLRNALPIDKHTVRAGLFNPSSASSGVSFPPVSRDESPYKCNWARYLATLLFLKLTIALRHGTVAHCTHTNTRAILVPGRYRRRKRR